MAEVAVDDVLFPLKLRIDALFAENGGRVGDSKEERERFHDKVYDLTYSWMEDYEKHSTPASSPERQLLPALVHAAEEEQKRAILGAQAALHQGSQMLAAGAPPRSAVICAAFFWPVISP